MKTATFRGVRYEVETDMVIDGFADVPDDVDEYFLYVDPRLAPMKHLEVAVHEAIHAAFGLGRAHEAKVDQAGKDISRFLWRLGYRRMDT